MNTKICTKCGMSKPLTKYPKSTSGKYGHAAECQSCKSYAQRIRRSRYPAKAREVAHNNFAKRPKGLNAFYTTCSRLKGITPSWTNMEDIKLFYLNTPIGYQVDHIVPITSKYVSGLHVLANLQYLTPQENRIKSNKLT